MSKKILTVAIIGVGSRGGDAYGVEILKREEKDIKVTAICDMRQARLDEYAPKFGVESKNCFLDEDEFFKEKRADALIVATQDKDHVRCALKGLKLGYDILCEKPITDKRKECEELLAAQKKYGGKMLICHVLRYAPAYCKVDEILASGKVGRIISIDAIEEVQFFHQCHSYVRGNWRRSDETSPMIMAKCCHDLDMIQHFVGSRCKTVSSVGSLSFFKKENQPKNASDRCVSCKYKHTCTWSAYNYLKLWEESNFNPDRWPNNVIAQAPLTKEKITDAIEKGPYGRCVFASDNNVVDHQQTIMEFENGVTASLCMTCFNKGGRVYHLFCTEGEVILSEREGVIKVYTFNDKKEEVIQISDLSTAADGHGGGDKAIVDAMHKYFTNGKVNPGTSLETSIESHLMAIAAEESRLKNGEKVLIHK